LGNIFNSEEKIKWTYNQVYTPQDAYRKHINKKAMPSSRFYFKKCCYGGVFYWPSKYQPVRESGLNLNVSSFIAVSFAALCPYIFPSPYIYVSTVLQRRRKEPSRIERKKEKKEKI
jgi:hypothetical protein